MRIVFVDFEASSLEQGSFPIEIAWVCPDGAGESHLIRPAPGWEGWSAASERVHGIGRAALGRDGEDAAAVALRAHSELHPDRSVIFSDAPAFDQYWMETLFRVAGCHPIPRLLDAADLNVSEGLSLLDAIRAPRGTPEWARLERHADDRASAIIAAAEEAHSGGIRHRALHDATRLWRVWMAVKAGVAADLAAEIALPGSGR